MTLKSISNLNELNNPADRAFAARMLLSVPAGLLVCVVVDKGILAFTKTITLDEYQVFNTEWYYDYPSAFLGERK